VRRGVCPPLSLESRERTGRNWSEVQTQEGMARKAEVFSEDHLEKDGHGVRYSPRGPLLEKIDLTGRKTDKAPGDHQVGS